MTNHKWIKKKYVKNDNSNQVISYEDDGYENNKTNNNEKPEHIVSIKSYAWICMYVYNCVEKITKSEEANN